MILFPNVNEYEWNLVWICHRVWNLFRSFFSLYVPRQHQVDATSAKTIIQIMLGFYLHLFWELRDDIFDIVVQWRISYSATTWGCKVNLFPNVNEYIMNALKIVRYNAWAYNGFQNGFGPLIIR